MAFQNVTFPNPKLVHGLQKEFVKQTKIITNGNLEYRINKQSAVRRRWTWQSRHMSQTDIDAIVEFSNTVGMAKDSFWFYCPIAKTNYKVRFEDASISYIVEAMNTQNTVTYSNLQDINLIEVIGE
jgi:hypothetical protein